MAGLSYLTTGAKSIQTSSYNIPTDESIGAMLFDISGFNDPFDGFPLLYNNFKNNTIQAVKNLDDASLIGVVDDGFLNGLLYYHVQQFYKMVGDDQTLYICIADCTKGWDVLQYMQQQVNGKLFHIGVWTAQPIWNMKSDGSMGFTSLITDLQSQADEINGKVGERTFSMVPLHIVLCGNSNYIGGYAVNYKLLPDALVLECPKVSVILAQNGIDTVHTMQEANPNKAPVSVLGLAMACLSLCGAEESIASLKKCDLNQNEEFNKPEWGFGDDYTPIENVNRIRANLTSEKGYIIPIDYEGLEASYFFSSDQTLTEGDFKTIANNRVMHKCRRAACTALLPYINSDQLYDSSTKNVSVSTISMITDSINTILDSVMRNKSGQTQIDGRVVEFGENEDFLNDDSISMKLTITPVESSEELTETVSHDANQ